MNISDLKAGDLLAYTIGKHRLVYTFIVAIPDSGGRGWYSAALITPQGEINRHVILGGNDTRFEPTDARCNAASLATVRCELVWQLRMALRVDAAAEQAAADDWRLEHDDAPMLTGRTHDGKEYFYRAGV